MCADNEVCARVDIEPRGRGLLRLEIMAVLGAPVQVRDDEVGVFLRFLDHLDECIGLIAAEHARRQIGRLRGEDILFGARRGNKCNFLALDNEILRLGRLLDISAGAHIRETCALKRFQRVNKCYLTVVIAVIVREIDDVDAELVVILHILRCGTEGPHLAGERVAAVGEAEFVVQRGDIRRLHLAHEECGDAVAETVLGRFHIFHHMPVVGEADVAAEGHADARLAVAVEHMDIVCCLCDAGVEIVCGMDGEAGELREALVGEAALCDLGIHVAEQCGVAGVFLQPAEEIF